MTITDPHATTGTAHALTARAVAAARRHRAADAVGFNTRHADWPRWTRRAAAARTIATGLGIPIEYVTVTDDPDRRYGITGQVPGDLITVADPDTGHEYQFTPDVPANRQGWLLLDECPDCGGSVSLTRVATIVDLGDWLDPNNDNRFDHVPAECDGDPGHRPECPHGPIDITT